MLSISNSFISADNVLYATGNDRVIITKAEPKAAVEETYESIVEPYSRYVAYANMVKDTYTVTSN